MFFMGSGAMTDVDQVSASATKIPVSQMTSYHTPAEVSAADGGEHETIIEPTTGWIGVNWREMFQSRELLYFLIWRDLKVRYKQAILGVGLVVLQPVMNMILFTLVFGS